MPRPSDPPAALEHFLNALYARTAQGIKLGLDVERAVLSALGDPQERLAFLHVAGTNGKGSVCAMIESVLRRAGFVTGLYTSPHLVRFNERARVSGVPVSDRALADLLQAVEAADVKQAAAPGGRTATFFEFTTALALEHFKRRKVQLAVLETGLGGRLDATNVVTPLLSVITRIDIEHTAYLGATIEEIAGEKAGIVKPGVPVVCGAMPDAARAVVRRVAKERGAPCVAVEESCCVRRLRNGWDGQKIRIETDGGAYGPFRLPLLGRHQMENAATAVAAVEALGRVLSRPLEEHIPSGLEAVRWPGRMQVIDREPLTLLDVAHNPDAARALAAALKELLKGREAGLVMGLLKDKDMHGFMRPLLPLARRCWTVTLRTDRAVPGEALASCATAMGLPAQHAPLDQALAAAREWARDRKAALVLCGSLFLAGEVLALKGDRVFEEGSEDGI